MNTKLLIKLTDLKGQISTIEQKIKIDQDGKNVIFCKNVFPEMLKYIEENYDLNANKIIGRSRKTKIKTIRHFLILAILQNERFYITLRNLGILFNFRDHTTILNAKQCALNFIATDENDLFEYNLIFSHLDKLYTNYNF
tara:strand:+ start:845 stop:1264 length:420 start_codon:yes stop_codon:yes gene_type:complete